MTLRILHISTRLILGGSQENTILSCEGQARAGHQVHLAFGPIFGPEGSMLDRVQAFNREFTRDTIHTHEVPDLVRQISPQRDYRARRQLRALIEHIKPDIVHTHSSKAGILGRLAAWGAIERPGIVHTIHGPPFMPVEGELLNRLKVRTLNHAYAVAERKAARRCHAIVSVADAMTSQFLARGIGSSEQYTTVRSGIDLAPYLDPPADQTREQVRARWNIAPGDFVIGTVARLAQHKGHDDILDALAKELAQRSHWKLLWVGDGWWADRLARRIEKLGLGSRVVRTGLVDPSQVPGLIGAMDVLCHPSVREGLPRTVPQALLCGVCPVAYDVDGTGEICIDRQTGRLITPGDTGALRNAIVELAQDPDLRHALAQTGQERCKHEFDARVMIERLEEVYTNALDRRDKSR